MTEQTAKELILAAKDAAIMLRAALRAARVSPADSPGFLTLIKAINKAESEMYHEKMDHLQESRS